MWGRLNPRTQCLWSQYASSHQYLSGVRLSLSVDAKFWRWRLDDDIPSKCNFFGDKLHLLSVDVTDHQKNRIFMVILIPFSSASDCHTKTFRSKHWRFIAPTQKDFGVHKRIQWKHWTTKTFRSKHWRFIGPTQKDYGAHKRIQWKHWTLYECNEGFSESSEPPETGNRTENRSHFLCNALQIYMQRVKRARAKRARAKRG